MERKNAENKSISLLLNDNFWGGELDIGKVIFKIIEDDEERIKALINGEIDIAENLPPEKIDDIFNNSRIFVLTISNPTVVYLSFNFRKNNYDNTFNPLSDIKVRKALYHAINITEIITALLDWANT